MVTSKYTMSSQVIVLFVFNGKKKIIMLKHSLYPVEMEIQNHAVTENKNLV